MKIMYYLFCHSFVVEGKTTTSPSKQTLHCCRQHQAWIPSDTCHENAIPRLVNYSLPTVTCVTHGCSYGTDCADLSINKDQFQNEKLTHGPTILSCCCKVYNTQIPIKKCLLHLQNYIGTF